MSLRAFLAVPLPDRARRAVRAATAALEATPRGRAVRWVHAESYHLTLRFLGEIDESSVPLVAAEVASAVEGCAPFTLRLGAVEAFPSARRPRVVAVRVGPEPLLATLAKRVEAAVVRAGFDSESRVFRAHLTLGRVRDRTVPSLESASLAESDPFPVFEVVLFQSELQHEGATYTPLERMPLGGPDAQATPSSKGDVHGKEHPIDRTPRGRGPEAKGHRVGGLDDRKTVW